MVIFYLYGNQPIRKETYFDSVGWQETIELDTNEFLEVTWENSPVEVELVIKH